MTTSESITCFFTKDEQNIRCSCDSIYYIQEIMVIAKSGLKEFIECGDFQCCSIMKPHELFCFGPLGIIDSPKGHFFEVSAGPGYHNGSILLIPSYLTLFSIYCKNYNVGVMKLGWGEFDSIQNTGTRRRTTICLTRALNEKHFLLHNSETKIMRLHP